MTVTKEIKNHNETMDPIRSLLQPVTHNLPGPIRDGGVSLIGETCYKALILDIDETNVDCIKLGISKGLGIGIIAASSVVKVPQILKLVNARAAAGVSVLAGRRGAAAGRGGRAGGGRGGGPGGAGGET